MARDGSEEGDSVTDTRQARHTMACAEVSKGDSGECERRVTLPTSARAMEVWSRRRAVEV